MLLLVEGVEIMKSENFETGNGDDTEEETNNEEEKVTSSIENIIPVKQISHGWKVLQGFAMVGQSPSFFLPFMNLSH